MTARTSFFLILALASGVLTVSCGAGAPAPSPPSNTAIPVRLTPTLTARSGSGAGPIYTEKVNLDAFAPPGSGRDLVIMNCDYCHIWTCAIMGQRTLDHWVMVEDMHRGNNWVDLPDADWNTLFTYLETNFNDQKAEPVLPPILVQHGCTDVGFR